MFESKRPYYYCLVEFGAPCEPGRQDERTLVKCAKSIKGSETNKRIVLS